MSIFDRGVRDITTKASRSLREQEDLCKVRKMNPKVVVLNKRGRVPTLSTTKASKVPVRVELARGFLSKALRDLQEGGLVEDGHCLHNPKYVYDSQRLVYGDYNAGASIVKESVIYPPTIVAASSGYYLVGGEMIYLHSDGSICRISQQMNTSLRCSCSRVHG
jgi:hypothetical protein